MGTLYPLINLYNQATLDAGHDVLLLFGLAWFKVEQLDACAGVYAMRVRRDPEQQYNHYLSIVEWTDGCAVGYKSTEDVVQGACAFPKYECSNLALPRCDFPHVRDSATTD